MTTTPPQLTPITCKVCGQVVAQLAPGALTHTTHLRCVACGALRTVRAVDTTGPKRTPALSIAPG